MRKTPANLFQYPRSRRWLRWLFPWFVIGRVQMMAEGPWLYPDTEPPDVWEQGYRKAMEDVLANIGIDPYAPTVSPEATDA